MERVFYSNPFVDMYGKYETNEETKLNVAWWRVAIALYFLILLSVITSSGCGNIVITLTIVAISVSLFMFFGFYFGIKYKLQQMSRENPA